MTSKIRPKVYLDVKTHHDAKKFVITSKHVMMSKTRHHMTSKSCHDITKYFGTNKSSGKFQAK